MPSGSASKRCACSSPPTSALIPWRPSSATTGCAGSVYGKAAKGGPPRRRGVLTVFGWSTEVLSEWIEDVWPTMATAGVGLWPSERGPLVSGDRIDAAFNRCGPSRRAARRVDPALPPSQLRDAPDRRRVRPLVRPGAGGSRVRLDLGHLHDGGVGLHDQDPARRPRCAPLQPPHARRRAQ